MELYLERRCKCKPLEGLLVPRSWNPGGEKYGKLTLGQVTSGKSENQGQWQAVVVIAWVCHRHWKHKLQKVSTNGRQHGGFRRDFSRRMWLLLGRVESSAVADGSEGTVRRGGRDVSWRSGSCITSLLSTSFLSLLTVPIPSALSPSHSTSSPLSSFPCGGYLTGTSPNSQKSPRLRGMSLQI